jgi:hypothetical protein
MKVLIMQFWLSLCYILSLILKYNLPHPVVKRPPSGRQIKCSSYKLKCEFIVLNDFDLYVLGRD